jgi:hypothetical protein
VSHPPSRVSGLLALWLLAVAATACAPRALPVESAWGGLYPDADTVRVTTLAAGVHHVYLWLPHGPWAVHVVEVDERRCEPSLEAVKAGPPLAALAPTTGLAGDGLAAINADFFMAPGGTPVGAHVRAGRLLVGPGTRPVYARAGDDSAWAGDGRLQGFAAAGTDTARIGQANRPIQGGRHHPAPEGLVYYDEWLGDHAATDTAAPAVVLEVLGRDDAGGGLGVVAAEPGPAGDRRPPGPGRAALEAADAASAAWLDRRSPGDTIRWSLRLVPAAGGAPAVEAVGGFPMLVRDGRGVYAEQTGVIASFGPVRHPRTAVGWDDSRSWWIVVDGRQAPYSDGMSLPELEWLFLRLGAAHAINLDGGGSTALAIHGGLVNRPSDAAGERAVANALVLRHCARP